SIRYWPGGTRAWKLPSRMTAPSRPAPPSALTNVTVPLATGWPSNVTVPSTVPGLPPQPASAATRTKPGAQTASRFMPGLLREDLAAVHRPHRLPGGQVDAVGDEADRAVGQGGVDAARVPAAGRVDPRRGAAVRAGHRRVVVRHDAAHGVVR